jgi:hypothetical protein
MLRAMFGAAVEGLPAHETFAARQVDAAMSTSHHVFALYGRAARLALNLLLIAFQYPVDERKTCEKQENFGQTPIRFLKLR